MTPAAETMMPAVLKQAGYVTSSIGKWGQLPLGPAEFGFDVKVTCVLQPWSSVCARRCPAPPMT
jgi:hypothetical protein